MKKENLYEALDCWLKANATSDVGTLDMMESADDIEICEIYQNDCMGINETYHTITLTTKQSITSVPKIFLFQSTDLLSIDKFGDIESVESIDYKVISQ